MEKHPFFAKFRFHRDTLHGVLFAGGGAFMALLLFYPGIFLTDSWSRWITARIIFGVLEPVPWAYTSWFPPFPAILKGLAFLLTGEFGFYFFMQVFVLMFLSFCLIHSLLGRHLAFTWGVSLLIFANPVVYCNVCLVTTDNLVLIGLLIVLLALNHTQTGKHPTTALIFLTAGQLLMFVSRYNSLVLLPVCVVVVAMFPGVSRWRRLAVLGLIGICLGMNFSLPKWLGMKETSVTSYLLFWEYMAIHQLLETAEKPLDYPLGESFSYTQAQKNFSWIQPGGYAWGKENPSRELMQAHQSDMRSAFINTLAEHPLEWLQVKFKLLLLMNGGDILKNRLITSSDYENWYQGTPLHIMYEPFIGEVGNKFIKSIWRNAGYFEWMRPLWLMLASLILVIIIFFSPRHKSGTVPALSTWIAATLYFAGFVLFTGGFYFRYIFPTVLLFLILIFVLALRLLLSVISTLTQATESPELPCEDGPSETEGNIH